MNADFLSLKLHVANSGDVWFINRDGPPTNSGQNVIQFMFNPVLNLPFNKRLVGTKNNAHLLLALFKRRMDTNEGAIEICSPLVCRSVEEREDPRIVLYNMRQSTDAASMGGWHVFDKDDYIIYALVSHIQKVNKIDDHARRLMKNHPIWSVLSFIPYLNIDNCCRLLATIIDPRWYINKAYPNRSAKLRSYLGLTPEIMRKVLNKSTGNRYLSRCSLVVDTWYKKDDKDFVDRPEGFLWRILTKQTEDRGPVIGMLRASQAFIDLLRLTWTALANRRMHQQEPLFISEYFFNKKEESIAFNKHLRTAFGGD